MISFAPYAHQPNRLEDFLPWGLLVADNAEISGNDTGAG